MMRWIGVGLAVFAMFILAPAVGLHSQAWSTFWFAGSNLQPAGTVPAPAQVAPAGPLLSDTSALMAAIQPYMGVPYVFGGNDRRGIDCSGLTVAVFRTLGYSLPRTAQTQYNDVPLVTTPDVGDLVFFQRTYSSPDRITHVGIVVAPGWMVSAIEPVVGRQSYTDPFWRAHLVGFGRVRHG
jgi:cell wall-associated NlpC family hydrolase